MNTKQTTQQIRNLISKGKLEEAANTLTNYFNKEMSQRDKEQFHLYNQGINLMSQLSDLKRAELSGILKYEDAEVERNKIRTGLLGLIDELEKGKISVIQKEPDPLIFKNLESSKNKWGLGLGIGGVLLTLAIIWIVVANPFTCNSTESIDIGSSLQEEKINENVPDLTIEEGRNEQSDEDATTAQNQSEANNNSSETDSKDPETEQVVPLKPDLIITGYSINPSSPREMETATISIKVKNNGSAVAKDIDVGWWNRANTPTPSKRLKIDRLTAGATQELTFPFTWYNIENTTTVNSKVEIDYNKKIAEENDNNNRKTKTFQVIKQAVNDNAPKPNLVVKIIMPQQVQMSAPINITLEVKNIGNAPANNFKTYWWASANTPNPSKRFTTESLDPGETKKLDFVFSWYSVVGSPEKTVRAKVDAENILSEEAENNNTDSKKIEIIQ